MQARILSRNDLEAFVRELMRQRRVMAPVLKDGVAAFDWLNDPKDLHLPKTGIPFVSPKRALLPQTEVLFYYKLGKDGERTVPPPPPPPQVLFAVHPCDVQAIRVLDTVFGAAPSPDTPYLARRRATAIVGLGVAPADKAANSFFEDLGISSMDSRDTDLFMTPLSADRFLIETVTDKGQELAASLSALPMPSAGDRARLEALRKEAAARVNSSLSSEEFSAKLEKLFNSPLWEKAGEKCVACGACAYLCPTCHCFDIQDETHGAIGCRVRNWDTCQFDLFTRHASGHNPRTGQNQRARQRIFHKFAYGRSNFHIAFCTGCGRCAMVCPMKNNPRALLAQIQQTPIEVEQK